MIVCDVPLVSNYGLEYKYLSYGYSRDFVT